MTPKEQLDLIQARYPLEGPSQALMEATGLSYGALTKRASKLKLKFKGFAAAGARTRALKTGLRFDYFDFWTPNSAWLRGYIWADGNVSNRGRTNAGTMREQVQFGCVTRDRQDLLEPIKRELCIPNKIFDLPDGMSRLSITNTPFALMIQEKCGYMHRKSEIDFPLPEVPEPFMAHFLRGYFDGDGSPARDGNYVRVAFYGNYQFIKDTAQYLHQNLHLPEREPTYSTDSNQNWQVYWQTPGDVNRLYNYLYPPGDYIFLGRKRRRLHQYLATGEILPL